ncbi:aldolase/citrate lyase family protein [Micromonospora sp. NBC_01699]|uniref:HpcH/HpaI aldolase/citrate lyase family protein n=1 Tax=Micromonospora sp. NBC_01699 TaxID=2975984 RepID=UPI002E2E4A77|nr:aldolase/citrate lyase family protein [Micromonospora sp. NBC_01699]
MTPRSHLYVPADQPRFLRSAARSATDALILDLEDAVAPANKDAARSAAADFAAARPSGSGCELWVRVNEGARGQRDAATVLASGNVDGIWLPKATPGDDLDAIAAIVAEAGAALGLLVESAAGLVAIGGLAAHPVVRRLQLGEVDLRADLGMPPDTGDHLLDWARGLTIAHAAAHGLTCVAPVSARITDPDGFATSSRHLRDLGFRGRACVHPTQVAVANEIFGADPARLADAHALLDRFEQQQANGNGAFRDADGTMVDAATVRQARELTGR